MGLRLSCEFFPPRTAAGEKSQHQAWQILNGFHPDFFSVTYGAGGSTHDKTRELVLEIQHQSSNAAAHLSFSGGNQSDVSELLQCYSQAGVKRIIALQGDQPGNNADKRHHAIDLVRYIRQHWGDSFAIEVAAYPEKHPKAISMQSDIDFLKQKLDAGADSAISQFFFNSDAWLFFRDQCLRQGISKPVYPGIMPITNLQHLMDIAARCGAEIPRWLQSRCQDFADDPESLAKFGTEFLMQFCDRLIEYEVPGMHFYTMNQAQPTARLIEHVIRSDPGRA